MGVILKYIEKVFSVIKAAAKSFILVKKQVLFKISSSPK